jgi:hypothetical protein
MSATPPQVPTRAVPVFVERDTKRRVMGATDWWFYPLVVLIAAGLIVSSLGAEAVPRNPQPQAAARDGAALVYGPHALARGARVDDDQLLYVVRDFGVSARAVRFAVRPNTAAPGANDAGAQILLDPQDTTALVGTLVDVELQVRRFSITAAGGIAVSLQNGGPVTWATAPFPPSSGPVTARARAPALPAPTALGLRMLSDRTDYNYGAEITRVTIRPAG